MTSPESANASGGTEASAQNEVTTTSRGYQRTAAPVDLLGFNPAAVVSEWAAWLGRLTPRQKELLQAANARWRASAAEWVRGAWVHLFDGSSLDRKTREFLEVSFRDELRRRGVDERAVRAVRGIGVAA